MNPASGQTAVRQQKARWMRTLVAFAIAAGALLFVAANAHLLFVAVTSQPDCVPHLKAADGAFGSYRAARSSC